MTILHYKAELLDRDGDRARFRYYPDHVMAPEVSGEFVVHLGTWDYKIVVFAGAIEHRLVSTDEHCVESLVNEIRSAHPTLPADVRYIR